MDSTFQKIGIYQIIGVLFTGMITLLIFVYLNIPVSDVMNISLGIGNDNDTGIRLLIFLVLSYFVGIVVQEMGEIIERLDFKKKKYKAVFLETPIKNNIIWDNSLELDDMIKIANEILPKQKNNTHFTEKEQEYVFFHCKDYLEVTGKSRKSTSLDSLMAMSRGFFTVFTILAIYYLYLILNNPSYKVALHMLVFSLLAILFYNRANKYSRLRVRAIMRHYKMIKKYASNTK